MNLLSLLDLALKSDEVVEILEHYDTKVIYDFDRLRENVPDAYWATFREPGFEIRFNERQVLDTIFMYVQPRRGFKPINPRHAGVPFYQTFSEAKVAFENNDVSFRKDATGDGWIKGAFEGHAVHYEFTSDGTLSLVTIMAGDA